MAQLVLLRRTKKIGEGIINIKTSKKINKMVGIDKEYSTVSEKAKYRFDFCGYCSQLFVRYYNGTGGIDRRNKNGDRIVRGSCFSLKKYCGKRMR